MARTIIEQLRYLATREEMLKSFRGRYTIQQLPDLYFRMSIVMKLFLGMNIGKI